MVSKAQATVVRSSFNASFPEGIPLGQTTKDFSGWLPFLRRVEPFLTLFVTFVNYYF